MVEKQKNGVRGRSKQSAKNKSALNRGARGQWPRGRSTGPKSQRKGLGSTVGTLVSSEKKNPRLV